MSTSWCSAVHSRSSAGYLPTARRLLVRSGALDRELESSARRPRAVVTAQQPGWPKWREACSWSVVAMSSLASPLPCDPRSEGPSPGSSARGPGRARVNTDATAAAPDGLETEECPHRCVRPDPVHTATPKISPLCSVNEAIPVRAPSPRESPLPARVAPGKQIADLPAHHESDDVVVGGRGRRASARRCAIPQHDEPVGYGFQLPR